MKKNNLIWVNCLVKNEGRWIWYAIMSVIDYVDKILVWDTGSSDTTIEIIKAIKSPKIEFKEYGGVTKDNYPQARQAMLVATKDDSSRSGHQAGADWMFILDGDEIWREEDIKLVCDSIREKGDQYESVVVGTINLVGDVFHKQEEAAGKYEIAGRKGHYNLRAMNMEIPGLHAAGAHGVQGYFDNQDKAIQNRDPKKILFLPVSYFHTTHLPRSTEIIKDKEVPLREKKRKFEIGIPLPLGTQYPEVFYLSERPKIVPDPWIKMTKAEQVRGMIQTPLKKLKRRLIS